MNRSDRTTSFDVDAQKGSTPLCSDEPSVPGSDAIGATFSQLASRAALRLGSKDAYNPKTTWVAKSTEQILRPLVYPDTDPTWVSHRVPDIPGFKLLDELPRPVDYDFFIWKDMEPDLHLYGTCYHDLAEHRNVGVIEYLKRNGVNHVLVGGLALDYCVKNIALQLRHAGFKVPPHLPTCQAIVESIAQRAYGETRDIGVILYADLERLDSTSTDADKEK